MKTKSQEIHLKGIAVSDGIAIGIPVFLDFVEEEISEYAVDPAHVKAEIERYSNALEDSRKDVRVLKEQLEKERLSDAADILEAHLLMMQDPMLTKQVEDRIRASGKNAEFVFHTIIDQFKKKFKSLADPLFRDRFKDIHDISHRVLEHLGRKKKQSLSEISQDSVIFAVELSASQIAEADGLRVKGFVTQIGSMTSHAAIVAKAKGIPFVTNIALSRVPRDVEGMAIVDGRTGELFLNPTQERKAEYREKIEQYEVNVRMFIDNSDLKAETFDGYALRLSANIEMAEELDLLHQFGGSGVGLYRSEFIFLSRQQFPTEEEQFHIYKNIVEKMRGLPIVFRVFDVGGDKSITGPDMPRENNPYLGCRAIRFLLQQRTLFKAQLRAIVRASAYGSISIMFPMISTLSELLETKKILFEATKEIESSGTIIEKPIRIGCMIEVPSAAIIADLLAKECDFLSIGTNDLVQYALAVDRGNLAMSGLYTPAHPSVIRLIKLIVNEANHHGIPVTVCGEMASDPKYIPLLLGLGVHELSVASRSIPVVKRVIRLTSILEASRLADRALGMATAEEIKELLGA